LDAEYVVNRDVVECGAGLRLMMPVPDVGFSGRITQQRFGQEFVRPMTQAAAL
jgi:hypothetical protein